MSRLTAALALLGLAAACDGTTAPEGFTAADVASAVTGEPVDPTTLTPPLNPEVFTCVRQGRGIICDGRQPDRYENLSPGPEFACGNRLILVTGFQVRTTRAWNDAEGRRLAVKSHGAFDETWQLEGSLGPVLNVQGRWNEHFVYATPGDVASRTQTITGNEVSAIAPGHGIVFQNIGITRLDPDGEVIRQGGPHDFYTNFEGAIAAACEFLDPAPRD
jgi:hypothetical protein